MRIVPDVLEPDFEYRKLRVSGFMPLSVDMLWREADCLTIALAHNYKHPSGDLIADPDMEIAVFPQLKQAEALSYQDTFGYRRVYPREGKVDLAAKRDLNVFLNQWLANLIQQGHR